MTLGLDNRLREAGCHGGDMSLSSFFFGLAVVPVGMGRRDPSLDLISNARASKSLVQKQQKESIT